MGISLGEIFARAWVPLDQPVDGSDGSFWLRQTPEPINDGHSSCWACPLTKHNYKNSKNNDDDDDDKNTILK